jgi:hypothetical protein
MAIGPSGKIVLEVDPVLKRRLYSTLTLDPKFGSLKDWFIARAEEYMQAQQSGSSNSARATQADTEL